MPYVFPSQVVELMETLFPQLRSGASVSMHDGNLPEVSAILRLCQAIPPECIRLSGGDYSDFVLGIEILESCKHLWSTRGGVSVPERAGGKHGLTLVYSMLQRCPDEGVATGALELSFISDTEFRSAVQTDISTSNSALHNGEWKAATVLAGATIEALLLCVIQISPSLPSLTPKPSGPPEKWNLSEYIDVAFRLNLITSATVIQAGLAKDFRNLIHPGRAQRNNQRCTRGTALAALAGLELVIADLSR